jgi:hypothetical protein
MAEWLSSSQFIQSGLANLGWNNHIKMPVIKQVIIITRSGIIHGVSKKGRAITATTNEIPRGIKP